MTPYSEVAAIPLPCRVPLAAVLFPKVVAPPMSKATKKKLEAIWGVETHKYPEKRNSNPLTLEIFMRRRLAEFEPVMKGKGWITARDITQALFPHRVINEKDQMNVRDKLKRCDWHIDTKRVGGTRFYRWHG